MITRYFNSVTVSFCPFHRTSRTARLFLSLLPSNARQMGVKVTTTLLPRARPAVPVVVAAGEKAVKRKWDRSAPPRVESWVQVVFKDGKEMKMETSKLGIKEVVEEVDRHSRMLARKDELAG